MPLTRSEHSASKEAVSGGRKTRSLEKGGFGGVFLKGVKLVKSDYVTKRVVARHMTRGVTGVKNGVRDRQKRHQMSLKLELRCNNTYVSNGDLN